MKQRFLNQKLGKRISRKTELQKAKLFARPEDRRTRRVSTTLRHMRPEFIEFCFLS
jgi:hypothetical protein